MGEPHLKKIGKVKIQKIRTNSVSHERIIKAETIEEKPLQGDIYQPEDSHTTMGIIYFNLPKKQFHKIEDFTQKFEKKKNIPLKTKENKSYYGKETVKTYYTDRKEKIRDIENKFDMFRWRNNRYRIEIERNNTEWKTVEKHETAKAL